VLSLNDCPEVRETFDDFDIEGVEVGYTVSRQAVGRGRRGEVLRLCPVAWCRSEFWLLRRPSPVFGRVRM